MTENSKGVLYYCATPPVCAKEDLVKTLCRSLGMYTVHWMFV